MKVVALNDRVVVKRAEEDLDQVNGLYIPDTAREKPQRGVVVSAGPNVKDKTLVEGLSVLFGKYSGSEIKVDGLELLILNEEELFVRVEA